MKQFLLLFIIFTFCLAPQSHAQTIPGKLLVVGGGAEVSNNWSDEPYSWAIDQSTYKRVAIIGATTGPSEWLPIYFMNLGAVYARNFVITNTATANLQATYDSLVTYDVIFFRGGNQWNYYNRYRNTLTQQAVEEVFMNGGVIGGTSAGLHILSEIVFTAQNGTVYPEEALENPFNQYMTLADDFLGFMPSVVFDSHVVERARFGRILGFLGNWKIANDVDILGVGVDDKTALCIDSELNGYIFGTGAVSIYKAGADNEYSNEFTKLLASNIEVMQLLHGCHVNFNTLTYSGLPNMVVPPMHGEVLQQKLWLSATDALNRNQQMLQQIAGGQNQGDTILIVTASASTANQFANYLAQHGAPSLVMQATTANGESNTWNTRIQNASAVLFVANTYNGLMSYVNETTNGILLHGLLSNGQLDAAFVGGNSRFAAKTVVINYDQQYASYDGLLETGPGLALLANSVVMPNTFSESIDNENAAAGVPYVMVNDTLRYGIWLHDDSFVRYSPNGNAIDVVSFGNFPLIFVENTGTVGGLSTQSAVGSGRPRHVAGFGIFNFSLMDESTPKQINMVSRLDKTRAMAQWNIVPNPASNQFRISGLEDGVYTLSLIDLLGRTVFSKQILAQDLVAMDGIPAGLYIVSLVDQNGRISGTKKLILK
jgi:cyanophycinase